MMTGSGSAFFLMVENEVQQRKAGGQNKRGTAAVVCGHGENDFVSESMNKSKQKSGEDDVRRLPLKRHSERG